MTANHESQQIWNLDLPESIVPVGTNNVEKRRQQLEYRRDQRLSGFRTLYRGAFDTVSQRFLFRGCAQTLYDAVTFWWAQQDSDMADWLLKEYGANSKAAAELSNQTTTSSSEDAANFLTKIITQIGEVPLGTSVLSVFPSQH